ncbi:leucine-rich repeat-containing protein 15-like isoform X2 [Anabas testudineus]|uniref:leucine-rich repeat-containing protein 15-like isoform X2 n=1 Tax=Anabas testudineus TaxID=64144 RepID=UPI000E45C0A0|nr:leucine-rich repeat-containing protein 15-like isoform X2 [Anabas testudineus]
MCTIGSSTLLLVSLLSFMLHALLAFSLKNCTIAYSENPNYVWVSCQNHELTAVPDDIPRTTTSLDISSNHILKITRSDFRGLSKLGAIEAQYNEISHIDDGAFADLAELTFLMMDYNNLISLTDNMFQGLFKLAALSLYKNYISYISPKAFQSLENLKLVILGSNQLHEISMIAPILQLPTLHSLFLGYNYLTSFESDELSLNVSNLRSLQLSMNPLRKFSITKDVFPFLQSLDFSRCFSDIEWDVSNKTYLRSLTSLFFSGVYISFEAHRVILQTASSLQTLSLLFMKRYIEAGLIDIACQISSLRTLVVTDSHIGILDDNLLRSCSQLTELKLSDNELSELSDNSLRSVTQLTLLQLDFNHLTKLPLALRGLSELKTLNLRSNFISQLDCLDFQHMTRLTDLNLNHNRLSSLQGCVFQNLNNLKVLDVGENAVFTFDGTFKANLQKLEYLNLHDNALLSLHQGDFGNLSSLSVLDLESDTYYGVYGGPFERLYHLQSLSLSLGDCREEVFRGLAHLENLTLHLTWKWDGSGQNNEPPFSNLQNLKKLVIKVYDDYETKISPDLLKGLKSLEYFMSERFFKKSLHPDTFKYTPQLRSLQIIHSDLSDLSPELFWPIPNLQALDLSNNLFRALDFLPPANLPALGWLKLSENKLSIINESVFRSLPALIYLDLTDNPLACECSNFGFNQWVLINNQTQVLNGHQYSCAFPVSQQGNHFLDFDIHSCWVDASFTCFISSTCLILFTLLASFIYHFLRWHLAYAYYLFLAFLYDKKRRKKRAAHQFDAFVSYNVHDEDWVYRELLPVLEGQQGWRLCLHHRDFEPVSVCSRSTRMC